MAKHMIRLMGRKGDEPIAEWDTETVTPSHLKEIEREFNEKMKNGYFAADITDGKNELIQKFDPDADVLLIPKMQGG